MLTKEIKNIQTISSEIKSEILNNPDLSLVDFKSIFNNRFILVDDGKYHEYSLMRKCIPGNLDHFIENMILNVISVNNMYHNDHQYENHIGQNSNNSFSKMKNEIHSSLSSYNNDFKIIKSISKSECSKEVKRDMLVTAYENAQSEISKIFDHYGIFSNYNEIKTIIKFYKEFEYYPIEISTKLNKFLFEKSPQESNKKPINKKRENSYTLMA